jgi:hypothetical protein
MKKNLSIFTILISMFSVVNISQANANVGGYAVVNPETGVVHGVIVASSVDPFQNGGKMPVEYMGCPAGCIIVQQSTADQNGNVAGVRTQQNNNEIVTYNQERNVFQVQEFDVTQTHTITDSASNSSAIETDITVSRSVRVYEFGVQDFRNSNAQFQYNQVAPPQNTGAQISATTKEFACEESSVICSQRLSNSSSTLSEEVMSFNERKTSEQVLAQVVAEARTKIREQLSLILSMLEKWIID